DVYAHIVEQLCNLELFLVRHGCTGTLLAVAQGGVENDDAVLLGLCLGSHESDPSLRVRRGGRSMGSPSDPPSAQAQMPSRPSGADKEKERAQNEGCRGTGVSRRPLSRAGDLPRRHSCPSYQRLTCRMQVKSALTARGF